MGGLLHTYDSDIAELHKKLDTLKTAVNELSVNVEHLLRCEENFKDRVNDVVVGKIHYAFVDGLDNYRKGTELKSGLEGIKGAIKTIEGVL